jgi:hypothetical protein
MYNASQTAKNKLHETSQILKDLFPTVYECLKIFLQV